MDNFDEAGDNPVTILACGAIALGAAAVGFLGGLVTGKGAATKESNKKLYKLAKGGKVNDIFNEKELKNLESAINNNRATKTKIASNN